MPNTPHRQGPASPLTEAEAERIRAIQANRPLVLPTAMNRPLALLHDRLANIMKLSEVVLGGGTILAARYDHRVSTDLDLFFTHETSDRMISTCRTWEAGWLNWSNPPTRNQHLWQSRLMAGETERATNDDHERSSTVRILPQRTVLRRSRRHLRRRKHGAAAAHAIRLRTPAQDTGPAKRERGRSSASTEDRKELRRTGAGVPLQRRGTQGRDSQRNARRTPAAVLRLDSVRDALVRDS